MKRFSNLSLGVSLILLVVVIWVTSSNVIEYIFHDHDFAHPFFLTWYNTSLFVLWLIPSAISHCFKKSSPPDSLLDVAINSEHVVPTHVSFRDTLKRATIFAPLWLFANYFFNLSLNLTSVSSNTIFSSTSSLFTLLFACLIRKLSLTFGRFSSVIFSIFGVALISYQDKSIGNDHLIGDAFALLSAVVYGVYTNTLGHLLTTKQGAPKVKVSLFFGLVGVVNLVVFAPFLFLLHVTSIEPFSFPSRQVLLVLTINAVIGTVLSDYLWSFSVILASPLIASLGVSLTIPLSVLIDVVRGKIELTLVYGIGTMAIVMSFFIATFLNKSS
ncbi:hypothetical protein GEMRC1_003899 [Eukaryota sp. GEM-RC1]